MNKYVTLDIVKYMALFGVCDPLCNIWDVGM